MIRFSGTCRSLTGTSRTPTRQPGLGTRAIVVWAATSPTLPLYRDPSPVQRVEDALNPSPHLRRRLARQDVKPREAVFECGGRTGQRWVSRGHIPRARGPALQAGARVGVLLLDGLSLVVKFQDVGEAADIRGYSRRRL